MSPVETRLNELGITLPAAPAPAANYVPFVITGKHLFVSGQISQGPDGLITGKLGDGLAVAAGAAAARRCQDRMATTARSTIMIANTAYLILSAFAATLPARADNPVSAASSFFSAMTASLSK